MTETLFGIGKDPFVKIIPVLLWRQRSCHGFLGPSSRINKTYNARVWCGGTGKEEPYYDGDAELGQDTVMYKNKTAADSGRMRQD